MRPSHRTGARPTTFLAILLVLLVATACAPAPPPTWSFPAQPAPTVGPTAAVTPAPTASAPAPSPTAAPAFSFVREGDCPESRFHCVTLAVPKDHAVAGGPTWNVTFAIQRAAKERRGTFVTITGGPGSSGISSADSYTDAMAESITDHNDIVFLDQRGIGESGPIACPDAVAVYYSETSRPQDPAQLDAVGKAAQTFVTNCLAEGKIPVADLPHYATTQAVEDLEAIRQYLAVDKLQLYGESYGTQFVQTYAAAHPDHIAALFVDGPVDLTISGIDYYVESTRGAEDTLTSTLADCTSDEACAADVQGGDLLAAYDALAATVAKAPIPFDFVTATGTVMPRELTVADLENAAFGYIYGLTGRMLLQRAIAAASQGDYVPLARLSYDALLLDPETLAATDDPTYSDAMYYAVECQDYAFYPDAGDAATRLAAWAASGAAAGMNALRLGTSYYGDLPCLYWPSQRAGNDRPGPIKDPPYPTFVLTSNTDPATPMANAMRIYSRLDDAYFLVQTGGPHVIFGWGNSCPDDLIADYLATGKVPPTRITVCPGEVADTYVPIAKATSAGYSDALDLAGSLDDQIVNTDDYVYRLAGDPLPVGCDFGGTLTYTPTDAGTDLALDVCAFTPDLPLTGTGAIDDESRGMTLEFSLPKGNLAYSRDGDGLRTVTGTYQGRKVSLSR